MSDRIRIICDTPPASTLIGDKPYVCCMCGEQFENGMIAHTHICRDATRNMDNYAFEAWKALLPHFDLANPNGREARMAELTGLVDTLARAKVEQRRALCEAMWGDRKAALDEIRAVAARSADDLEGTWANKPPTLAARLDQRGQEPGRTADGEPLIVIPTLKGVQ